MWSVYIQLQLRRNQSFEAISVCGKSPHRIRRLLNSACIRVKGPAEGAFVIDIRDSLEMSVRSC